MHQTSYLNITRTGFDSVGAECWHGFIRDVMTA